MSRTPRVAALLVAAAVLLPATPAVAGSVDHLVSAASSSSSSASSAASKVAKANAKSTASQINEAVATVPGAAPAAPPERLEGTTRLGTASMTLQGVTIGLPAEGTPTIVDRVAVYSSNTSRSARIGVQAVSADEIRALINITGPEAPERYEFPFSGQVAALVPQPDGSVLTLDAAGEPAGTVAAPWARDAAGNAVPTHFEVQGTVLVQVVEHRGRGFQYGITADPSFERHWWGYTVALDRGEVAFLASSSTAAAAKMLVGKVKHPAVRAAVGAAVTIFMRVARVAKRYGRCMIWHATWTQPHVGWWTFPRGC